MDKRLAHEVGEDHHNFGALGAGGGIAGEEAAVGAIDDPPSYCLSTGGGQSLKNLKSCQF